VNRAPDKDTATVMSYSRLSLESEAAAAAANSLPNHGAIRHHPNGLVTFSPPQGHPHQQPLYANTNGYSSRQNGNTVSVSIRTGSTANPQGHSVNGTRLVSPVNHANLSNNNHSTSAGHSSSIQMQSHNV
jgi:hypothetical protein